VKKILSGAIKFYTFSGIVFVLWLICVLFSFDMYLPEGYNFGRVFYRLSTLLLGLSVILFTIAMRESAHESELIRMQNLHEKQLKWFDKKSGGNGGKRIL